MAMAIAMALRRLSSSFDKPLRPALFKATSLYYMVILFLFLYGFKSIHVVFFLLLFPWKLIKNQTGSERLKRWFSILQSSLPDEAVYEKEKPGVTVRHECSFLAY